MTVTQFLAGVELGVAAPHDLLNRTTRRADDGRYACARAVSEILP